MPTAVLSGLHSSPDDVRRRSGTIGHAQPQSSLVVDSAYMPIPEVDDDDGH